LGFRSPGEWFFWQGGRRNRQGGRRNRLGGRKIGREKERIGKAEERIGKAEEEIGWAEDFLGLIFSSGGKGNLCGGRLDERNRKFFRWPVLRFNDDASRRDMACHVRFPTPFRGGHGKPRPYGGKRWETGLRQLKLSAG